MPLSRPEPLYFWVYFVFMNAIWIAVPSVIILASSRRISRAVSEADRCAARQGAGTPAQNLLVPEVPRMFASFANYVAVQVQCSARDQGEGCVIAHGGLRNAQ